MAVHRAAPAAIALLASVACSAPWAQEADDSTAHVLIGGAGEWGQDGRSAYGPNLALEVSPFNDWLELEIGETRLAGRDGHQWETDFQLQLPFYKSATIEADAAIGPTWSRGSDGNSWGLEIGPDLYFFPWPRSRFGLYAEPSYSYSFGRDHEHSFGISAGLTIAIP